mgnify:CR=1 FL=1
MLSINECRKLLKKEYQRLTDNEIMDLCKMLDALAEVAIKTYYYDSDKNKTSSPDVQGKQ